MIEMLTSDDGVSFARALLPHLAVGAGVSLTLHFLAEPFLPAVPAMSMQTYPLQITLVIAGLFVVLRWQAAHQRFREARKHLQTLNSKLTDLAVLSISLDEKNLFDNEFLAHRIEASEESKHRRFVAVLVHLVSLLHAIAVGTLSGELSPDHIKVHHISDDTWETSTAHGTSTPQTARTTHSHRATPRQQPTSHPHHHCRSSQEAVSIAPAATTAAAFGAPFVTQPSGTAASQTRCSSASYAGEGDSMREPLLGGTGSSHHQPALSAHGVAQEGSGGPAVALQLTRSSRQSESPRGGVGAGVGAMRPPRMQLAPLRLLPEAVTLLTHRAQHTARSMVDSSRRYFSRADSRVGAAMFAGLHGEPRSMDTGGGAPHPRKIPVIMGLSGNEAAALGMHSPEPPTERGREQAPLSCGTVWLGAYLPPSCERPHTVHAWLAKHLMYRVVDGGLGAPGDTATRARMHDLLSDAMHGYEQAKKLTESIPPPAAQALLAAALWAVVLLCPVLCWLCTTHVLPSTLLSCMLIFMPAALAELTRDLEDPFSSRTGRSVAIGSLGLLQFKLNERLLAVATAHRPHSHADVSDRTEALATTAAAISARAALVTDPTVSSGAFEPSGGNTPTAAAGHAPPHSGAHAHASPRSPLHSATVSPEARSHRRSPTLSRFPSAAHDHRASATGSRSGTAHTQPGFETTCTVAQSMQSMSRSEAQGSVEVNFTVPATVTASTEYSGDSPRSALGSITSLRLLHAARHLDSTTSSQGCTAATEAVTQQTLNAQEPSMHASTQLDSGPPTASTHAPTEAEADHSLATSLSSDVWVLGKLAGESIGHSGTFSIGRERGAPSHDGSSSTGALGRAPGMLLEASRSFPSRHTRVNSLESAGMDSSVNLDWMGVPVMCPPQAAGAPRHVSSRSIVRNDEFEEVLNCSRALVHGIPVARNVGPLAPGSSEDVVGLSSAPPSAASTSKLATTQRMEVSVSEGSLHGSHATYQGSPNHNAEEQEGSRSEGQDSAVHGKTVPLQPAWSRGSAVEPHDEARMHGNTVAQSWPQGFMQRSAEGAERLHVFQPGGGSPAPGREAEGCVPRPRTPTSLVMWQAPADAA